MASAMTRPSAAMRVASHDGTWPPCNGRSALPVRRVRVAPTGCPLKDKPTMALYWSAGKPPLEALGAGSRATLSLSLLSAGGRMSAYELAQLNIGIIRGPMDSPVMAHFAANLERINALADRSPGFVWRLQTEEGDATGIRPFEQENMLLNMSVWRDIESLSAY